MILTCTPHSGIQVEECLSGGQVGTYSDWCCHWIYSKGCGKTVWSGGFTARSSLASTTTPTLPASKSWVLDDKNAPGVQMRTLLQLQTILIDVITFKLCSFHDFTHIVADSYCVTK